MARLRYNGLSTTLGGSLTSSATSVTFGAALTYGGGTNVPTISGSDYIPLSILDSTGRLAEIVYLTAYTSGATTGTITRAQEGTTGAARASGLKVTHGPLVDDVGVLLASTSYNPASSVVVSVGTTEADLDATNLAITFVAPASGNVLVRCGVLAVGAASQSLALTIRDGTTQKGIKRLANGVTQIWSTPAFLVTGLTPRTSYTYKMGAVATAAGTSIGYGGTAGTAAGSLGAATMEVWSA